MTASSLNTYLGRNSHLHIVSNGSSERLLNITLHRREVETFKSELEHMSRLLTKWCEPVWTVAEGLKTITRSGVHFPSPRRQWGQRLVGTCLWCCRCRSGDGRGIMGPGSGTSPGVVGKHSLSSRSVSTSDCSIITPSSGIPSNFSNWNTSYTHEKLCFDLSAHFFLHQHSI